MGSETTKTYTAEESAEAARQQAAAPIQFNSDCLAVGFADNKFNIRFDFEKLGAAMVIATKAIPGATYESKAWTVPVEEYAALREALPKLQAIAEQVPAAKLAIEAEARQINPDAAVEYSKRPPRSAAGVIFRYDGKIVAVNDHFIAQARADGSAVVIHQRAMLNNSRKNELKVAEIKKGDILSIGYNEYGKGMLSPVGYKKTKEQVAEASL